MYDDHNCVYPDRGVAMLKKDRQEFEPLELTPADYAALVTFEETVCRCWYAGRIPNDVVLQYQDATVN